MYNPFFSFWSNKLTLTSFLSSASTTSEQPRTRHPRPKPSKRPKRPKRPKHKTTPSPEAPQIELGKYVVPGACGTPSDVILRWQFNLPPNNPCDF